MYRRIIVTRWIGRRGIATIDAMVLWQDFGAFPPIASFSPKTMLLIRRSQPVDSLPCLIAEKADVDQLSRT
jgi:hypothetical protein